MNINTCFYDQNIQETKSTKFLSFQTDDQN